MRVLPLAACHERTQKGNRRWRFKISKRTERLARGVAEALPDVVAHQIRIETTVHTR